MIPCAAAVIAIILAALYYHKLVVDSYESALFDASLHLAAANARAAEHRRLWKGMSVWNESFARAAHIDSTCPDVAYFVAGDAARRMCADKVVVTERALEDARASEKHWESRYYTEKMSANRYMRAAETYQILWRKIRDHLGIECFENDECAVSDSPCMTYTCQKFKCESGLSGGAECYKQEHCETTSRDEEGYTLDFCNHTTCHCDRFSVDWRPVLDHYGYPKWYPVEYAQPLVPEPGME